jgi:rRNA-processing protein FCF1
VVLVVEGAARDIEGVPGVRVVRASGSGDDAIVDLVRESERPWESVVVTADRGLRDRVRALVQHRVSSSRVMRP